EPDELLQWDVPLNQQPVGVREKLEKLYGKKLGVVPGPGDAKKLPSQKSRRENMRPLDRLFAWLLDSADNATSGSQRFATDVPSFIRGHKDQTALRDELAKAGI